MDYLPIALSIIAGIISAYSLYNTIQTRKDTSRAQIIRDAYSVFFDLDRLHLQNWQLAHLFVTPDRYKEVVGQIAKRKKYSFDERSELMLRERAIAYLIFDNYEHTLYQWEQAVNARDKGRADFLGEVLGYLTLKTLRNPRLLYYWALESEHYEAWIHEHYKENVLANAKYPLESKPDIKGPFAAK